MTERPAYRAIDVAPQLKFFDCPALRASLSTKACGQRWGAAALGSTCHGCVVGRMHFVDHNPTKRVDRRQSSPRSGTCTRCGRTDLRLVMSAGSVCVSCYNRQREHEVGRNARGRPPATYRPLRDFEVAIQRQDGAIERRILEARDDAEAIARVLRDLPEGARLLTNERRHTAWNMQTGEFEIVCPTCGIAGLVLERVRGGKLERHAWCCAGEPPGEGWRVAPVRQQLMALSATTAADALNADPDLADQPPCSWTPTAHPCSCGAGQVEALLAPGGRWQCRCTACGASSP